MADASSQASWLRPGVMEVRFSGHVAGATVGQANRAVAELLKDGAARFAIFETTDVTGFDPSVRSPGVELLSMLKKSGVRRGVAVTPLGIIRMIGAALALAAGMHLSFFATRDEALTALAAIEAKHS